MILLLTAACLLFFLAACALDKPMLAMVSFMVWFFGMIHLHMPA